MASDSNNTYSVVSKLGPYDVLCGRDKLSCQNAGNRRFRALINANLPKYLECQSKFQRSKAIGAITKELQENPNGSIRFFKRVKGSGTLGGGTEDDVLIQLFNEKQSREKIAHALRDYAAQHRNSQAKQDGRGTSPTRSRSSSPINRTVSNGRNGAQLAASVTAQLNAYDQSGNASSPHYGGSAMDPIPVDINHGDFDNLLLEPVPLHSNIEPTPLHAGSSDANGFISNSNQSAEHHYQQQHNFNHQTDNHYQHQQQQQQQMNNYNHQAVNQYQSHQQQHVNNYNYQSDNYHQDQQQINNYNYQQQQQQQQQMNNYQQQTEMYHHQQQHQEQQYQQPQQQQYQQQQTQGGGPENLDSSENKGSENFDDSENYDDFDLGDVHIEPLKSDPSIRHLDVFEGSAADNNHNHQQTQSTQHSKQLSQNERSEEFDKPRRSAGSRAGLSRSGPGSLRQIEVFEGGHRPNRHNKNQSISELMALSMETLSINDMNESSIGMGSSVMNFDKSRTDLSSQPSKNKHDNFKLDLSGQKSKLQLSKLDMSCDESKLHLSKLDMSCDESAFDVSKLDMSFNMSSAMDASNNAMTNQRHK